MEIPRHRRPWYLWFAGSLAAFGVLEWKAMTDDREGTTLSATWWDLRTKWWARLLVIPPLAWAIHHLFNPWDRKTGDTDDATVVAAAAVVAFFARYKPRRGI